jgi:hypothetical protein
MAYEQRPDSGILFRNHRKGDNAKAPDWKGTVNVEGEEYELAAWEREGKKGPFLSIKVSRPYRSG